MILIPEITVYLDPIVAEHKITLNREDIEELHVSDFAALLESQGIQILNYGGYGLQKNPSLRGFTDETVRVVIDGLCVNNAQYGTFDFSSLNIDEIEEIVIIKGGYNENVSDEGAVGGVIYITTRKQNIGHNFYSNSEVKSFYNAERPFDTFSQYLGYDGQIGDSSFLQASVKGTFAGNYFPYKNKKTFCTRNNSEVLDGNGNLKFSNFFPDGTLLTAGDLFYAGKKQVPGPVNSTNQGEQIDFNNKLAFNLVNPALFDLFKLETDAAWFKDVRFYTDNQGESRHFVDTIKFSGQADFFEWGKNVKFQQKAGLTGEFVLLDSTDDGRHTQISFAFKETTKIIFNRHFTLSIPLALKNSGKNFAFIPKIGFNLTFYDFAFLLNGYRMVQFPNMDDLYWHGGNFNGNPDLQKEDGWGGEFSFVSENFILPFSFTIFSNYYSNKIQWAADEDGNWKPQNVASAFYLGIDFDCSRSFFNNMIILSARGEYLYTRLLGSDSMTYGKKIMWTPDFTASLNCDFNLKYGNININMNYVGKRFISNLNARALDPYLLINLSGEFNRWDWIKPYFRIDNLLNWNYSAVDNYPMPGISLSVGLKLTGKTL